jgi:uncharacterized membrane protein
MNRTDMLRKISIILSIAGLIVAGYLVYLDVSGSTAALCSAGGGCDTVRESRYSQIGPIPVALIGVGGYLAILLVLLLDSPGGRRSAYGPMLVFGFALIGVLYSLYLTYLELFVIVAICPYCMASAIIVACIFIISIFRLGSSEAEAKSN